MPSVPADDSEEFFASFSPVPRTIEEVRKGMLLAPHCDINAPGFVYSSAGSTDQAKTAARERELSTLQFEAFRALFSDKKQSLLVVPEVAFDSNDPDLYQVFWSKTLDEWRADLAPALVSKGWRTPTGMVRRVWTSLKRGVPKYGTAIMLELATSEVYEDSRSKKTKQQPANGEAAAPKDGTPTTPPGPAAEKPVATKQPPATADKPAE
ncbi:MAG TPA: hypothetical protein VGK74_27395 [Symbiobacteriaceae bacterium]